MLPGTHRDSPLPSTQPTSPLAWSPLQPSGPKEKLDLTAVSQPAIYVASLAALEKLKAEQVGGGGARGWGGILQGC